MIPSRRNPGQREGGLNTHTFLQFDRPILTRILDNNHREAKPGYKGERCRPRRSTHSTHQKRTSATFRLSNIQTSVSIE